MIHPDLRFTARSAVCALVLAALATFALAQNAPQPPAAPTPAAEAAPAAAPTPEAAVEKTFLGYRWANVSSARYKVASVEETTITRQGGPTAMSKEKELEFSFKTVGKDAEKKTWTWIELHIDGFKLKAMPQGIELDTRAAANPKAGPLAGVVNAYAAIKDKPIRLLVTPGGRVQKVEGEEELAAAARAAMPGNPAVDQILQEALVPLTPAEVADRFANVILTLPGKPVPVGFSEPRTVGQLTGALNFTGVEENGGKKFLVVKQSLAAHNLPPTPIPAEKLVLSNEKYEVETTLQICQQTGLAAKLVSLSTNKQAGRKDGADPASAPALLIQTTTKSETTLVESTPAATPEAAPAGANGDTAALAAPTPGGTR